MNRQTILPANEQEWLILRIEDLTSTDMAALFSISPYLTNFELWHRKKDKIIIELEPTERMVWGNRLQDSIAFGIAEERNWEVERMKAYMRLPEVRLGSSFDFRILSGGLLEIKNVDSLAFQRGWLLDGDNLEAPPHIELQVQHQLLVSGEQLAFIGALVGGNRLILIKREPDPAIHEAIQEKAADFWMSIDASKEPQPDFERDAKFIASLYKYASPGKLLDATNNPELDAMVQQYVSLGKNLKEIESARDAAKAKLLMKIGEAEKVTGESWTISAGLVGPAHIAYDRAGYRSFKVFQRGVKNAK